MPHNCICSTHVFCENRMIYICIYIYHIYMLLQGTHVDFYCPEKYTKWKYIKLLTVVNYVR